MFRGEGDYHDARPGIQTQLHVLLAFVTGDERAPRLRAYRSFGFPYNLELTVWLDLTNHHRLVQVVVGLVHLQGEPRRRLDCLPCHRYANLVHIRGAG